MSTANASATFPRWASGVAGTSANGDVVVGEDRLRALLAEVPGSQLPGRVHDLLGSAWDDALEPFRLAGDSAPITWLHQVG